MVKSKRITSFAIVLENWMIHRHSILPAANNGWVQENVGYKLD